MAVFQHFTSYHGCIIICKDNHFHENHEKKATVITTAALWSRLNEHIGRKIKHFTDTSQVEGGIVALPPVHSKKALIWLPNP